MRTAPFLLLSLAVAVPSCRPADTWSGQGPNVELRNTAMEALATGDWARYRAAYADTAVFFVNSEQAIRVDDYVAGQQAMRQLLEWVRITEPEFAELRTATGPSRVLVWGKWMARVKGSGQQVSVPMHTVSVFAEGRIVEERVYADLSTFENAVISSLNESLQLDEGISR